jgi:hypothetical protein
MPCAGGVLRDSVPHHPVHSGHVPLHPVSVRGDFTIHETGLCIRAPRAASLLLLRTSGAGCQKHPRQRSRSCLLARRAENVDRQWKDKSNYDGTWLPLIKVRPACTMQRKQCTSLGCRPCLLLAPFLVRLQGPCARVHCCRPSSSSTRW